MASFALSNSQSHLAQDSDRLVGESINGFCWRQIFLLQSHLFMGIVREDFNCASVINENMLDIKVGYSCGDHNGIVTVVRNHIDVIFSKLD